jgi:Na+-transporting methylmalonyl-CoA/oxaloacetate decarboxylase beta subunit
MENLLEGLLSITWQQVVMILVGLLLIYLAIKKEYEPMLLLPMGFGALLANIPLSSAVGDGGFFNLTERGRNFNGIISYTYIYSRRGHDRF